MKKYIFLFIVFALGHSLSAQVTTLGTDFYVSFGNNNGYSVNNFQMQIRIAATQVADVTLTFMMGGSPINHTINAGEVYTYRLSDTEETYIYSNATGTSDKSLRIQSTTPVSVYALTETAGTADATNVLPVSNLGTDYYHVSYQALNSDGYTIVATENGTTIYENGSTITTLNVGQVYSSYFSGDGTGKHITSTHPVAYYVTNACTNVPTGISFCDCLYQQLAPVNAWGNNFLVPATHRQKERVRIIASQNNTTITQTGGAIQSNLGAGSLTLNTGQFVELEITSGGCFISANKPVAVTSYLTGAHYVTPVTGDPAMAWVPPIEQMISGTAIAPFAPTSASSLNEHYALVVTPTNTYAQTTVAIGADAPVALSGGTWTTGPGTTGSAYSFYAMPLTNINSSYYFHNPNGLTVMGYGLGSVVSYYYMAGASARNLDAAFYITNTHYQDIDGEVFCGQQSFAIRAVIQYAMSNTAGYLKWYINGTEETAARDVLQWNKTLAPGTYLIEMKVLDTSNQTHTMSTTITVKDQAVAATITTTGTGICNSSTVTLTGASTGVTDPVYRWYASQTATTPLHTGATYTTPTLTANTTYYVSVEGSNYCENAINTRKAVTVTVNATLTSGAIGTAQAICSGSTPAGLTETTAPGGGTGTYTYQWQSSSTGATNSWTDISGATSATYQPGALTANTYFRRNVTSGSCGTVSGNSILITVNPLPAAPTLSSTPAAICPGSIGVATITAVSGVTTDWYTTPTNGSPIVTGNNTLTTLTALNATTTYYAEARNTTTGCRSTARLAVTITVLAIPAAPTLSAPVPTVCSGNPGVATVTPPAGCTTDWYDAATGGQLVATGNNTLTTPTLTTTDTTRTVTYYAESRHTTAGCRSTTRTAVEIKISPCVVPVNPLLRSRVY
ncbi:MAG: hypothetical protein LBB84_00605 [Tannerellaceae bacterium]|jgi:hypothetical protein|nr:hypothetical protein [Tannerellaceae bacterium]